MVAFVILFAVLLLERLEFVQKSNKDNDSSYISKSYTNQLRGVLAITVVYYHLALVLQCKGIFSIFSYTGNYAVGVFFFLSGYGLLLQYRDKGQEYLKGFIIHRILSSLLIPYLLFNALYYLIYVVIGKEISVYAMTRSWIDGHPLVSNSWYIIAIFYFYFIFYLAALLSKTKLSFTVVLVFLGSLLWMIICHTMGYGDWWFYSCFAFPAGMFWLLIRNHADTFMLRWFWIKESILLLLCILLYHAAHVVPLYLGMQTLIYLGCMQLSAIIFCVFFLWLGMRIRFNGRILKVLGSCSLELYLIHGLFMTVFHSSIIYIKNDLIFSLLVLICSVVTAYILHVCIFKSRSYLHKIYQL